MDDEEQMPEVPPPATVVAFIACLVSFMFVYFGYWLARPMVKLLEDGWVQFLVYAFVPMTVTFIILYRSDWHPEITGAARTCLLILLSGIIFFLAL